MNEQIPFFDSPGQTIRPGPEAPKYQPARFTIGWLCNAALFERRFIRLRNTRTRDDFIEVFGRPYGRMNIDKAIADCKHPDTAIIGTYFRPFDARMTIMPGDRKGNGIVMRSSFATQQHFLIQPDGRFVKGYYFNRMHPFDPLSEPLDLVEWDRNMMKQLELPDALYLSHHPFIRDVIDQCPHGSDYNTVIEYDWPRVHGMVDNRDTEAGDATTNFAYEGVVDVKR